MGGRRERVADDKERDARVRGQRVEDRALGFELGPVEALDRSPDRLGEAVQRAGGRDRGGSAGSTLDPTLSPPSRLVRRAHL